LQQRGRVPAALKGSSSYFISSLSAFWVSALCNIRACRAEVLKVTVSRSWTERRSPGILRKERERNYISPVVLWLLAVADSFCSNFYTLSAEE
jgi:hypothetical protein